jgi:signal transduction histidine kinase
MYLSSFFNYYRIGRFIFALALLISFQIAGLLFSIPKLMFVISVYSFIALIRLIASSRKINYFDFLLDIVFISVIIYISIEDYSYLTLLYLFPIFFASVLIKTKKIFLFPAISAVLYGVIYYSSFYDSTFYWREGILNISLHLLSFSLIALAGDNLKERMENQERHIKLLEDEKIKMQGYERLYRVSADLAHELKNPLTSISAAVQFLKEGRNDREFIEMLNTETKRLTNLVNDFLLFSRPSDAPKEEVDMSEMLTSLINRYGMEKISDKKITLNIVSNALVIASRTFLEVAVNNIIKNAIEAAKATVMVTLRNTTPPSPPLAKGGNRGGVDLARVSERGVKGGTGIVLEIEDDGSGIDEDIKDKIFEPFFTTKEGGTGLGLAIAYRIITGFGGNIFVDKSTLGGARFTIVFQKEQ